MTNLPDPPVAADLDLRDFAFMPLDVARLRRSKAWLICKRRPELAFYLINLWTAAWHDLPSGSLEDDDDVLADLAMCPPKEWKKLRGDVLRGWTKCSDGRLYHPVVTEKAEEAWRSKIVHAYDRECGRLRKAATRAGNKAFIPPTFEEWKLARLSAGHKSLSNGQTELSTGQIADKAVTSQGSPQENALKGQGQGQGQGQGYMCADTCPADKPFEDTTPHEVAIRTGYPAFNGRQDWTTGLRNARALVENGMAAWDDLIASVRRFAIYCGAPGMEWYTVLSPAKFFGAPDRPWAQDWLPPATKAETRMTGNIAAAEQARRELFGDKA